jgi:hypothetical protein
MEDQLISFETAKLAKEKEFDLKVIFYYDSKGLCKDNVETDYGSDFIYQFQNINGWAIDEQELYSAPTQSLLQKWLREKHKIIVSINIMSDLSYYSLSVDINENKLNLRNQSKNRGFDTYELALEDGLQEALKLIVKK